MNITTFCSGAFVGSLLTFVTMCVSYSIKTNKIEEELRQQLEEVTQKHWNECRQIAHYSDENKRIKEQIEQLIKEYEKC
jgi:hypothetical protein